MKVNEEEESLRRFSNLSFEWSAGAFHIILKSLDTFIVSIRIIYSQLYEALEVSFNYKNIIRFHGTFAQEP